MTGFATLDKLVGIRAKIVSNQQWLHYLFIIIIITGLGPITK